MAIFCELQPDQHVLKRFSKILRFQTALLQAHYSIHKRSHILDAIDSKVFVNCKRQKQNNLMVCAVGQN